MARGEGRRRREKEQDPPMAGEGNPRGGNAGHNAASRAEVIRQACRDIAALEAERNSLSKDISDIKQTRIKAGLGMKISDFNIALRLHKLEGDDRSTCIDTVRECFKALGVGEQLDWVTATQQAADRLESEAGAGGEGFTEAAGFQAGKLGRSATTNPHPIGTPSHTIWAGGWAKGQAENAAEMGG